ncbi:hypothetical protein [Bradyrhizobium sp. Arg816]|uniref:hypothetical protein n=1 Tax=Bradyrhizobium sp. Arg816 TaxID=2998491 RepID=UPI00249E6FF7|nr:hypothetical protein [Bradyrhizobium sp. Arg816]MDI3565829.1 hypothetical protein [Bradyrhizobium sp. Arg816]
MAKVLRMVVSPVTAIQAVRKMSPVFAVVADMAMSPAEYQPGRFHDPKRGHHVGASKFFSPGQIFGNRARSAGGLAPGNPVQ